MRTYHKQNGYSSQKAEQYINSKQAIFSLSTSLEEQKHYEDGKATDEIAGYKAWFSQKELPPFQVKFSKKIELPSYMSVVEFEKLQACEIGFNVYFKAENLKEIK